MRCLWAAFCMAQEMGAGLGGRQNLFRTLQGRAAPEQSHDPDLTIAVVLGCDGATDRSTTVWLLVWRFAHDGFEIQIAARSL